MTKPRQSSRRTDSPARPSHDCFDQEGLPRRFGRYHLLRLLARGGMGEVFLAATTGVEGTERPVVVKVIRREHARDPNFLARFLDEARVQAQLQGSGVAQIVEAATYEPTGDPYVVLEFVEGKSLGQVRRRLGEVGARLKWEEAVSLGVLVCDALAYIHERRDAGGKPLDIVHRDLSPHNVMVGYGGELKIIDFGTARGQNRRCHTVAGVVFAKPGYVAPEVAGGDSGDFRVDMYAAGVILWELCAGRRFLQGDAQEHMAAVAAGKRDLPPIAAKIGAPAALDVILAKMTRVDREARHRSCREAAAQLAALLEHATPLPNGERGVRARVAQRMYNLYPAEPGRSRSDFARFVAAARASEPAPWPPPAPAKAPPVDDGRLPGTRYRIDAELGRGASSVVYAAEHVDLGRRVALKVLDAEHTHSIDFAARFRREARSLSRLTHPGLVRVFDFGQASDGRLFCAMELLEGRSLRQELEIAKTFSWPRALRVVRQACQALAVAHEHGLIHRDIKPDNLFIGDDGVVKLIDFGLARAPEEGPDRREDDLGAMTLFGTPEYMAPEQVSGGKVDHRADLYGLGCVLYEMLTGSLPFTGKSAVEILDRKLEGSPEPIDERAPTRGFPRALSRLVDRALARHASRRFETAAAMVEAIDEALEAPSRRRRRRRAAGGLVVAAIMSLGMVLVVDQAKPWLDTLPAELPWLEVPPAPTARPEHVEEKSPSPPGPSQPPEAPAVDAGRISHAK